MKPGRYNETWGQTANRYGPCCLLIIALLLMCVEVTK